MAMCWCLLAGFGCGRRPFTVTRVDEDDESKTFALVLRSTDQSVELIDNGMTGVDRDVVGRFLTTLPDGFFSRVGLLLPDLLAPGRAPAPSPVLTSSVPGGLLDSTMQWVSVERAGIRRLLPYDVSADLSELLRQAAVEARKHPVEAIQLHVARDGDCIVFVIEDVGTGPVTFANPLSLAAGCDETDDHPCRPPSRLPMLTPEAGTTGLYDSESRAIPFRYDGGDIPARVTLEAGKTYSLRSVPWIPDGAHHRMHIEALWKDWGESRTKDGVFRVHGFLRALPLEIAASSQGG